MVEILHLIFHAANVIALMPQRFKLGGGGKKARQLIFPQRVARCSAMAARK